MATPDRIRALIESGTIPQEEGLRLLEAYTLAEERDRVVLEECRRLRAAQRSRHGGVVWGIGLGVLLAMVLALPGLVSRPSIGRVQPASVSGDPNTVIEQLERRLRRPGRAEEYRRLGLAYQQRYEDTGNAEDRQRGLEALDRADRLERSVGMRNPGVFGAIFGLVIVTAIGLWIMMLYNGLAKADERVNERWAQVEAVLQRRLDLVPQLVETVKGYASHERQTLMAVTEARAKALGVLGAIEGHAPKSAKTLAELGQAQQELAGSLGRLLAIAEQYPELKASGNFLTLQDQLEGTENRIAVERQRYNDGVREFNGRLRVFPSNVVGSLFGYDPREYFESKLGAEDAVAVKF